MIGAEQKAEVRTQAFSKQHIPELDGLRAFAILPVIFNHCFPPYPAWIAAIGQNGWVGVDLFFVLSGFLITGILVDTLNQRHFYWNFVVNRTLRIFPLYYACLALFCCAALFMPGSWSDLRNWGGPGWFVVYVGNINTAIQNRYPPIFSFGPLWSLQVEEQFYLLFPLAVATLRRRALRWFLLTCVFLAPLIRITLTAMGPGTAMACYVLTPCRMDALALGGLVALSVRDGVGLRKRSTLFGIAACAVLLVVIDSLVVNSRGDFVRSLGYTLIALFFAGVLRVILHFRSTRYMAWLRWSPLTFIGTIAYGLYLLHGPVSWIGRKLVGLVFHADIGGHHIASIPITFGCSILVATLCKRYFEDPIRNQRRRFIR